MGLVAPDNVHETGVSPGLTVPIPIVAAEAQQVEQVEENDLVTGPDPRFLCPSRTPRASTWFSGR